MKLDPKGIEVALQEMIDAGDFYYAPEAADVETAILAYLLATDTVLVPSKTASSAVTILIGLSLYWRDEGDEKQSEYIARVARSIHAAESKE
jgi:hypothetical protein